MWGVLLLSACSTPVAEPPPAAGPSAGASTAAAPEPSRAAEPPAPVDRPPTIEAVNLTPAAPTAADTLVADVKATDPEGARLDFDFEWTVNDAPVVDVATERLAGRFKKGDKVRVRATADDGTTEVTADSPVVTIVNTPPAFVTTNVDKVDGFRFQATDPDGDPLTWRLEGAPRGMTISRDGVLAYQGAEDDPGGRYTIGVVVEDGDTWARIDFPLTVSPGSKAKAASK